MVFCVSFIVNCAKPDAPIKGPKHVFNIGTYRPVKMCMCSAFLLTGCCLDDKQSPFVYKYNLSQKVLSTLNIYKIVIRLKSQVLSKEDSRLVADRQTCNRFFWLKLESLGTLDRRAYHLSYQSGSKSPQHIFFVLTNLNCFDLGTSLKKLCLSQGNDVSLAKGNIHFDRQTDRLTDRLTDREVGRHIYSA